MHEELIERLKAERDRMWTECRLPTKRTYTTATPDMIGQAADRIEALTAEVRRLQYDGIHTCHAECPRLPCVQRREIEALTAELAYHGIYPK